MFLKIWFDCILPRKRLGFTSRHLELCPMRDTHGQMLVASSS